MRYDLKILHQCGKRVETKSQKVLEISPTFVKVTWEKLVGREEGGGGLPPSILNRVKVIGKLLTFNIFSCLVQVFSLLILLLKFFLWFSSQLYFFVQKLLYPKVVFKALNLIKVIKNCTGNFFINSNYIFYYNGTSSQTFSETVI